MGRIKDLLEQEWENLTRDEILDMEYQEWINWSERPAPRDEDYDSSITEQGFA